MGQGLESQRAFSLVELSIVLVILGLLTGGILSGQSLIRAAEMRAVTTELNRLTTAVYSFRDKYFAMPGDMNKATTFWAAADAGDGLAADCGNVENAAATCNGNGNGVADNLVTSGIYESLRVWQHLALAGLIEGSFLGAPTSGGIAHIGSHLFPSKAGKAGYEMHFFSASLYRHSSAHYFKLAASAGTGTGLNNAFLSAEEAWNIDTKMDDGQSDNGKMVAIDSNNVAGCVTNGTTYTAATTGSYILTNSFAACRFYFYPGF